jgi:hypothetical protein
MVARRGSDIKLEIKWLPCEESEEEQAKRWDCFLNFLAELLAEERMKKIERDKENQK